MNDIKPSIRSVSINEMDIQYLYYEGGETTILFLHATGFLPWIWHPIAREFAGKYTVVAPYICDHRVVNHEEGLNWMVIAEDFCRMCEKLGLNRPYLVGHSMGGTVISIANAMHGSPAEKMVMIEPIFLPEQAYRRNMTVEQHPLAAKAVRRKNLWKDREEVRAYLRSKKLFAKWDEEMLELYLTYGFISGDTGGLTLACPPKREAALFMGSVRYNPWPHLSEITCPVLVIEGEKSENRQFIDLKKVASMIPNGRYSLVPDAGHLIPMEKPGEICTIIKDFISE